MSKIINRKPKVKIACTKEEEFKSAKIACTKAEPCTKAVCTKAVGTVLLNSRKKVMAIFNLHYTVI